MAARKFPMAVLSTLPCLLLIAAQGTAKAEGFLDLYSGAAASWTADVRVSESTSSGTTYASASIDLSSTTEFGARFGVWFPTYNWIGLAMDTGYIRAGGSSRTPWPAFGLSFRFGEKKSGADISDHPPRQDEQPERLPSHREDGRPAP